MEKDLSDLSPRSRGIIASAQKRLCDMRAKLEADMADDFAKASKDRADFFERMKADGQKAIDNHCNKILKSFGR